MNHRYLPDEWLLIALLFIFLFVGCVTVSYRSETALPTQAAAETPAALPIKLENQSTAIVWCGPENRENIALTFDDGPNPEVTPLILDILAKHHAKATFFLVGEQAERFPELVHRIASEGHELGSHTMSHPQAPKVSGEMLRREVKESSELIQQLSGKPVHFFRPPYGYFNADYFQASKQYGLTIVLWSIVPRDWERPSKDILAKRVIDELQPGSIILLHDGGGDRTQTVAGLSLILDEIANRQWRAVGLSELLR